MHARTALTTFIVLAAAAITGCQAPKRVVQAPEPIDPRRVPIFAGDASGVVPWNTVVETCAEATVVLIGETHGQPLGLALAADLFEDILAANPRAVLSMEFYERDHQAHLDDYLAGITTAEQFDKATFRNEGNNPIGHRRMLEASRTAGRPVIAANSPRRYTRLARIEGYDRLRNLTNEQQRLFDIPDSIPDNAYTDRFRAIMGQMGRGADDAGHSMPGMTVDAFLQAQLLWDQTMADSIADAISLGAPVVHVVGQFHSDFGTEPGKSALTDAIAQRLLPNQNVIIISVQDAVARTLKVEDVGKAHFVTYVGTPEPPPAEVN
ncbi:MAG: ChaN family lipoprotein [Phycisphaerales bacterium]